MNKETLTTSIARVARKNSPNVPTLALARKLHMDNPGIYTSVEHARTSLRTVEGKMGAPNRKKLSDKSLFKDDPRPLNPYNLPEPDVEAREPYKVTGSRVLLLSDIHLGYHSTEAVTLALDFGKDKNADTIILNGDTLDFYQASRFEKDPRKRSIADELENCRQFLDTLKKEFPQTKIIFKVGNHENRLERYLRVQAPVLLGVPEFELKNLLKLDERGIDYVDSMQTMKLNALNIFHGHELVGGSSTVNIARTLFTKTYSIAIQGHNHQTSENSVTTSDGHLITTWSTGCLCDLKPNYMPFNRWNAGFAWIEADEKEFQVYNKRISSGKVF